ncbi:MAG: hypothetical protein KAV82_03375 [Phycisphaerae bacterium]|nr:hypothetical protein [Phycisphaerae bacterium]
MPCPTDAELQAYARSPGAGDALNDHLRTCAACRQRMESLVEDADTLEELLAAWVDKLDDGTEQRIAEICRGASEGLPPSPSPPATPPKP